MAIYGVFDGHILVNGTFSDYDAAEESAERLEHSHGYFGLEVRQVCPDHEHHGVDDCFQTKMFQRALEGLQR